MKKLLALLFLATPVYAGTISTYGSLMTVTLSSAAASGGSSSNPLTFVQIVSTATTDGGCGSTLNITPSAGNLLVVGCGTNNNASGITVSDNNSNSWLNAGTVTGSAGYYAGIWYVKSCNSGATIITAATNGCNGQNYCVAAEYSGQNTSSPFDVFSGSAPAVASSIPITSLSATTSGTNETMFNFLFSQAGGAVTGQNGTARYKNDQASISWYAQDANVASAGAYTSTWTESSYYTWLSVQAAFTHP